MINKENNRESPSICGHKPVVFISCGQRKGTDEVVLVKKISAILLEMGFSPYIAVNDQSPLAIRENIFRVISMADYYLFIDLKREAIVDAKGENSNSTTCRGSLITHQELAIASFLELPTIAFQEKGVEKYDGLIGLLQLNCIEFRSRRTLPKLVKEMFIKRGFRPEFKNKIEVKDFEEQTYAISAPNGVREVQGFFLEIQNLNPHKYAKNCIAFVERVISLNTQECIQFEKTELKWCGVDFPTVTIPPLSGRQLDALAFYKNEKVCLVPSLSDSGRHKAIIRKSGIYEITYSIHSESFPPIFQICILNLDEKLNSVSFRLKKE